MSEYRLEYSFDETVKKMTEEVQRKIDQEILDANAHVLEEFGYVKVVRCRDCEHFTPKGTHKFENGKVNADYCKYVRGWMLQITPDGFCAWAERKEGGE